MEDILQVVSKERLVISLNNRKPMHFFHTTLIAHVMYPCFAVNLWNLYNLHHNYPNIHLGNCKVFWLLKSDDSISLKIMDANEQYLLILGPSVFKALPLLVL